MNAIQFGFNWQRFNPFDGAKKGERGEKEKLVITEDNFRDAFRSIK